MTLPLLSRNQIYLLHAPLEEIPLFHQTTEPKILPTRKKGPKTRQQTKLATSAITQGRECQIHPLNQLRADQLETKRLDHTRAT